MRCCVFGRASHWRSFAIGVLGIGGLTARAQSPPVPAPTAPPPAASGPATTREAQLEERIRQLESMVNRLSSQVQQISTSPAPAAGASGGATGGASSGTNKPAGTTGAAGNVGEVMGGSAGSQGPTAPPASTVDMPAPAPKLPMKATFGPGFQLSTEDDEYQFQFHNLTQFEFRGYEQGGQSPIHDTFALPREWLIFSGRLTKPYEYYAATALGFDTLNVLDAYLNIHYDDRFQLKLGRYKTPYTYEFYTLPINGLINPERSLFFNNFGLNRDIGAMLWGQGLFDKRLDYAVGVFNGTRNGFLNQNDAVAVASYLNFKPFGDQDNTLFQNLNIGGSVFASEGEVNPPVPQTLRTNIPTTGNAIVGIPFLSFNNNVRESGPRAFWSLHSAYYYNHLSLIAEWESGFQDYAFTTNLARRTNLPVQSFYVQAGYFLTGETVTGRGALKPLHPFDLRKGKGGGLGAIELVGRYSALDVGREVFTDGLADRNLWSNRVYLTDLGINWYWTQYVKVYLDWEHAEFGDPVQFAPNRKQLTSDQFWVRFQIYF
jgi:phosphate-selective porin OprO/OprP